MHYMAKNYKQFMKTIEELRADPSTVDLAVRLEQQLQVLKRQDEEEKAKKNAPFSPDQVEVAAFITKTGTIEHVIGVGYKKLSPHMWRKYLGNPETVAKILELANSDLSAIKPTTKDVA
jgi:hypothetical protein